MPVSTVERPVSALRQRMLEDMAMRGLRSDTQHDVARRFGWRGAAIEMDTVNRLGEMIVAAD